jgi:Putative Flp pilus-assembly TadE/G-like
MSRALPFLTGCRERGQILVLAALMMFVLVAIAGLAIDVSAAYMADRWQRAVADEAALAGGQDLQIPGSRDLPGPTQQLAARQHAMDVLGRQLGASMPYPSVTTGSSCLTSAGCSLTGTPYVVAIQTPSPSYVDCQPERCIQVSVRQPSFGLTFARIFGQDHWSVNTTSVAGKIYEKQYGIVTLRPPKDSRGASTQNSDDIFITGGSKVVVGNADVATNTNLVCSGSGSQLKLDPGYLVYHWDTYEAWVSGSGLCLNPPPGSQLTSPIADPNYPIPQRTVSTRTYNTLAQALDPSASNCLAQQRLVPDRYRELKTSKKINDPTQVTAVCVRPGIYKFALTARDPASGLPSALLLEPGVYFLDWGATVQSSLIGGYDPGNPGVALVFKEAKNQSGDPGQFITANSTSLLALNFGDAYCPGSAGSPPCTPTGQWAGPADGPQGPAQTPGKKPVLITLMVVPDANCPVGLKEAATCNQNNNKTLKLDGGGNIFLAGVQYAPTDNAVLTGNSGQKAEIGAFWSYSVAFKGGTQFTMATALPDLTGVLRLDPACSPTVSVCNP